MPRILAVEIPGNKKLPYSLCYIYGIGQTLAKEIVEASGLDPDRRASSLSEEEINKVAEVILAKGIRIEGDLRREITQNIKRLHSINCYRGQRHRKGLPVRGQRTKCNARTRKGKRKTVGVQKKAV
ncbi:MAG: 30S ribosomal protein S13 [Opitutales bacterium]|jgi:small subunit ribosomal protein S13